MLSAGRSFTEPPGLNHSALAANSTFGNWPPMRSSRKSGVLPMQLSTDTPARPEGFGVEAAAMCLAADMARTPKKPFMNHLPSDRLQRLRNNMADWDEWSASKADHSTPRLDAGASSDAIWAGRARGARCSKYLYGPGLLILTFAKGPPRASP